jgi:3'(2'), 5'-bisphosphate nucleotidase
VIDIRQERAPINGVLATDLTSIAKEAGRHLLELRSSGQELNPRKKPDESIVSDADTTADEFICDQLQTRYPDIPILSEEGDQDTNEQIAQEASTFFCIDPLDGSRGYLQGTGFSVLISIIRNGKPTFGVIHDPVLGQTFYGGEDIETVIKTDANGMPEVLESSEPKKLILTKGQLHPNSKTGRYINEYYNEFPSTWALAAMKFCLLAEGKASVYPNFAKNFGLWDIAAGDAILSQLGGAVTQPNGEPIDYTNPSLKTGPFIASASGFTPKYLNQAK